MCNVAMPRALMWMALAALPFLSSCSSSSASDTCSVFAVIHPDADFQTRWTEREQVDVLKNNDAFVAVCGSGK